MCSLIYHFIFRSLKFSLEKLMADFIFGKAWHPQSMFVSTFLKMFDQN